MKIEQIYTGCLSQGAYYIVSNGEAAIIDPLRETDLYIEKARKDNVVIKYVFETHFHADFVSGHLDLAAITGAEIVYGPTAQPGFTATIAADGQVFQLGAVTINVLHTPGHTMESSCYLLKDEQGQETAIFTGDTLFLGDVGRPDLAQNATGLTTHQLAALLYDSLRSKIMPLPDHIIVYPGHGQGSACGKNMSSSTMDTLGHQKGTNYALRPDMTKEEFIKEVTDGLAPPPFYFPYNAVLNKKGYERLDDVMKRADIALTPTAFEKAANDGAVLILDTRKAKDFAKGFIPGSINIGIDGDFAPWVGRIIANIDQQILIVADQFREKEVITRLARVGYDHCIGYLEGGIDAWLKDGRDVDTIISIDAEAFVGIAEKEDIHLVDVRRRNEYNTQHIMGAVNMPLDEINSEPFVLPDAAKKYYVHCAAGYRSMIYISVLRKRGYRNLTDIQGGFNALKNFNQFKLSEYHTAVSML